MKKLLFFIFFLCSKSFSQQEYAVSYDYKIVLKKNGNLTTEIKTNLFGNGKESYYVEDFMKEKATESENNFSIKATENTIFYKNFATKTIVYKDQIRMKFFNIKDTISGFDWKITTDRKTVLGYECQKATLFFRGRNYVAYFTNKIPFQDGPWKFSGLPGMILDIMSDEEDIYFSLVCEKIELKKGITKFEDPYIAEKTISYKEFVAIYNKKYNESKTNNAQDSTMPIWPKARQEVYVTD